MAVSQPLSAAHGDDQAIGREAETCETCFQQVQALACSQFQFEVSL